MRMARSSPNWRCNVGAPRRRTASSIDGRSSRISEEAWIISIAAAASISFSALQPAASPAAMVSTPRTRLPDDSSARASGSLSGFGAPVRAATFSKYSSSCARRAAK